MNAFTRFAHDAKKFLKPKNLKAKLRGRGKVFPILSYTLICLWVLVFAYLVFSIIRQGGRNSVFISTITQKHFKPLPCA